MLTQLRKVQRFLHTCAETIDKSHDHKWREITCGRDIKTYIYMYIYKFLLIYYFTYLLYIYIYI